MQLSARYNAVLELTEEIFKDKSPADGIINAYLRERKYIGSGDRRFIAETVWKIIRHAGGWSLRHSLPIRGGFCWFI